jgi:RNA polymerase sigma-70 factor (ECF subfamily)
MNEQAGDEIVSEFNKGDQRSFSSIFNTYYSSLCYFAEKMILDKQEAEDIVEESFVKLWRLHANFETMQNVKAFLYITTKNACINFIKQSERNNKQQSELLYTLAQKEDHVLTQITKAEVLREVHAAIENLPPQCRKIVRLSFVEGLKNQEIADKLNLSLSTVKNQKMRAIALLKMKLLSTNLFVFLVLHSHLADKN